VECQHHLTCRPIGAAPKCQGKNPRYCDKEGRGAQNEGRAEKEIWSRFETEPVFTVHGTLFGIPDLSVVGFIIYNHFIGKIHHHVSSQKRETTRICFPA